MAEDSPRTTRADTTSWNRVDAWGDAIPIAAQKGDHRPARELLQHVGIVEDKKDAGVGLLVLTKIEVNGVPAAQGSDGNVYEFNADTGEIENLPKAETIVSVGLGEVANFGNAAPTVATINGIQLHGLGTQYGDE